MQLQHHQLNIHQLGFAYLFAMEDQSIYLDDLYYFHNFLTSQPDLNYHCDSVRAQILDEIEFWLKLGVDGVRLDAINYCYHDASLRNNPEKPLDERIGRGFSSNNPYAAQYHKDNVLLIYIPIYLSLVFKNRVTNTRRICLFNYFESFDKYVSIYLMF